MSAYNLIEFLPPVLREEDEDRDDPSWLKGRSWVPETYSHTPENAPAARKRRLRVAAWNEGWHSELPISECVISEKLNS
jgi:hypothetical protein